MIGPRMPRALGKGGGGGVGESSVELREVESRRFGSSRPVVEHSKEHDGTKRRETGVDVEVIEAVVIPKVPLELIP